MKKLLCYIIGHHYVPMKEVANKHYLNCEWCSRCKKVKDFLPWIESMKSK